MPADFLGLLSERVLILDGASFRNPPAERRKTKKNSQQETSA